MNYKIEYSLHAIKKVRLLLNINIKKKSSLNQHFIFLYKCIYADFNI